MATGMTAVGPTRESVCAIIVTFRPDTDFPNRLRRASAQVSRVVIVDNGSSSNAVEMLCGTVSDLNIHLILNKDNLGVATALNQGIESALSEGYDWVLMLDQDTEVDVDLVKGLQHAYVQLQDQNHCPNIGIIASNYRYKVGEIWKQKITNSGLWVEQRSVITSGSLLSLSAYRTAGRLPDNFFIDMVDTEYCFRLRMLGYRIYMTAQPLMTHSIGAKTPHKLLWMNVSTTNHSASRRYYIARNRIVLIRKYLSHEPVALWCDAKNVLAEILAIVLYERDKSNKLSAFLKGIRDGLVGRMGKTYRG